MMGHRGCRLAVTYPEIAKMQTSAVIRAAIKVSAVSTAVTPFPLSSATRSASTTYPALPSAFRSHASPPLRLLSNMGRTNLYFSFKVNFDQAEAYRKSTDQYLRAKQWEDLTVEVFI